MAWLFCRKEQGHLVLRMEDIDPARSRHEYATAIMDDLCWLGIDWDEGPTVHDPHGTSGTHAPYTQSRRHDFYEKAISDLHARGLVYPCFCTRKELRELAGAPHIGDEGAPYPGLCRELAPEKQESMARAGRRAAARLRCPDEDIAFTDGIFGPQRFSFTHCGGDFALRRSDGVFAYQLAVSVDDALMGINQVVRGRDILLSTPRQLYLFDLLGHAFPLYYHLPLVCDAQGERLAKRHQSLAIRALRDAGVSPEKITGYLAWKAGLQAEFRPLSAAALLESYATFPSWWKERDIRIDENPLQIMLSGV